MPQKDPENMTTRVECCTGAQPLAQHVNKEEAETKNVRYEQGLNIVDTIFCI